jgi:hypothetical protein
MAPFCKAGNGESCLQPNIKSGPPEQAFPTTTSGSISAVFDFLKTLLWTWSMDYAITPTDEATEC